MRTHALWSEFLTCLASALHLCRPVFSWFERSEAWGRLDTFLTSHTAAKR